MKKRSTGKALILLVFFASLLFPMTAGAARKLEKVVISTDADGEKHYATFMMSREKLEMEAGESRYLPLVTCASADDTSAGGIEVRDAAWKSSNSKVVSVKLVKVKTKAKTKTYLPVLTARKAGKATITATCKGKTTSCKVTVIKKGRGVYTESGNFKKKSVSKKVSKTEIEKCIKQNSVQSCGIIQEYDAKYGFEKGKDSPDYVLFAFKVKDTVYGVYIKNADRFASISGKKGVLAAPGRELELYLIDFTNGVWLVNSTGSGDVVVPLWKYMIDGRKPGSKNYKNGIYSKGNTIGSESYLDVPAECSIKVTYRGYSFSFPIRFDPALG